MLTVICLHKIIKDQSNEKALSYVSLLPILLHKHLLDGRAIEDRYYIEIFYSECIVYCVYFLLLICMHGDWINNPSSISCQNWQDSLCSKRANNFFTNVGGIISSVLHNWQAWCITSICTSIWNSVVTLINDYDWIRVSSHGPRKLVNNSRMASTWTYYWRYCNLEQCVLQEKVLVIWAKIIEYLETVTSRKYIISQD